MTKIAIGTKNVAKIKAIKEAVEQSFSNVIFTCEDVPSQVSAQPIGDQETMIGAINRANLAKEQGQAEIGIGLEGGVIETPQGMFLCNWGALIDGEKTILASGAKILLPQAFIQPLKNGVELGKLMDEYTQRKNIREGEGAVGIFTNGLIDRKEMFVHVTKLLVGQYLYQKGQQHD